MYIKRLSRQIIYSTIVVLYALNAVEAIAADEDMPTVAIFTNHYPPYAYRNEAGEIVGESVDKVRALMESAELNYEIALVPWTRALRSTIEGDHTLIFPLNRSPEREDDFVWLLPLNTASYYLYARNDEALINLTPEEIVAGDYKAVCERDSSSCAALREFGFDEDEIVVFTEMGSGAQARLVVRGRVDFVLEEEATIKSDLEKLGLEFSSVVPVVHFDDITDYLAASRNADMELIAKLQMALSRQ